MADGGPTPLRDSFAGDPGFKGPAAVDRAAAAVRNVPDGTGTKNVERPNQGSNMNIPTTQMAKWTDR